MTVVTPKLEICARLRRGVTWSDGKPIGAVVGEVNDPIMVEAAALIEQLYARIASLEADEPTPEMIDAGAAALARTHDFEGTFAELSEMSKDIHRERAAIVYRAMSQARLSGEGAK